MKIGVYGLGRFGSFWAAELSKVFPEVVGYSRNTARMPPEGVTRVGEAQVLSCDVIFLCIAISSMETVLRQIRGFVKPGALIIDTCSVKIYPLKQMEALLPEWVEYLGTHPMFGPDSGKKGIGGLPIVVSEGRLSEKKRTDWIRNFKNIGLDVIEMTAEAHDREAAYTQGITHFIGRVLDDLDLKRSKIGTLGFGKLLEIMEQTCNDPWQLFIDLQRFNPYTSMMRKELNFSLNKIITKLESSLDRSDSPRYDV